MPLRWTSDETQHLISTTLLHEQLRGRKQILYPAISRPFPNRSTEEVRSKIEYLKRKNRLESPVRPSAFTSEESRLLIIAVQKHGPDFELIQEAYFRKFSAKKLHARYLWQIQNSWNDQFFRKIFPLINYSEDSWGCKNRIVDQSPWDGFLALRDEEEELVGETQE
ncbi:Myb-like DNA-binding domain-containing protein [Spironucleus salmonicida]|uniref:Myb-like DNA-binding domain-containing protein n=1 Tax=Spironucleus salmonicida TaxID=348837 RepID=V6LVU6_9EUKA|nr:Myb-like DNA-binding domain-containing protein [Spironucleus salmonicida]|eukprot:EST44944.1 Myb-like DNA-binding domain-containing protein [Spironucleus salmonicida]